MRVLFVTPRLPYLPCHEAARLAASHLVDHLVSHHTVAIVAATGGGDTPARRGWLASRAAVVETVPGGRWRRALSGRPADALGALDRLVRWVATGFAPDVIHLEGALLAPLARAAAGRLAGAILPRVRRDVPRAELLLAGTDGTADAARALGALPGVRVSGSLGDLRASVWGAAVYVSPLDAGFGRTARLLEPMALGTPVVASPPTLSGLPGVVAGQHVLSAESDEEFASAIRRLLREPLLANTLARTARQLVERRFTWRTVAERYETLYARLAPAPAVQATA